MRRTTAFPATDIDTTNPVYMERNDQRQDMNGVAFTVVNLEKLEKWFYEEYLDSQYDNNDGNQSIDKFLTDEITGNKTKLVIYVSRTPTVAEVPGWAGYTADGGPPYPYYDNRPLQVLQAIKIWKSDELLCPTTIATDNPIYIEGDFNYKVAGAYPRRGAPSSPTWRTSSRTAGITTCILNSPPPPSLLLHIDPRGSPTR